MVNFFISWLERLQPWLKKLQPGLKQLATMVITRLSPVTRLATCLGHIVGQRSARERGVPPEFPRHSARK